MPKFHNREMTRRKRRSHRRFFAIPIALIAPIFVAVFSAGCTANSTAASAQDRTATQSAFPQTRDYSRNYSPGEITSHYIGIQPQDAEILYDRMRMTPAETATPIFIPQESTAKKSSKHAASAVKENSRPPTKQATDADGFLIPPDGPGWRNSTYH